MSISAEKVAYLKGLADGMKLNEDTNEGKLFLAMIDAIAAVSSDTELLESRLDKLGDYVDEMDELINQIADAVYEKDDEYFDEDDGTETKVNRKFDFDEDDNDYNEDDDEDEDEDEDEDDYITVTCPHCGALVAITGDISEEEEPIECPMCGKPLFPQD